jgi:hypothetical protein
MFFTLEKDRISNTHGRISLIFNINLQKRGGDEVMMFNTIFNNLSVSFIGEGNQSTRRKPLTSCKSLTNLVT